jgi:hypothetical protein
MLLSYNRCQITINDTLIECSYPGHYEIERWQIILDPTDIRFQAEGKKEVCFKADEVQKIQFEMGNGALKYGDIPAALAYVVLKTDPDPKDFFQFSVPEEYVLLNQTKAHEFCNAILNYLGERYEIPVAYKLSVDTQKKRNAIAWVPVILIITFLILWLRLKFSN